jgi:hypothetical protein
MHPRVPAYCIGVMVAEELKVSFLDLRVVDWPLKEADFIAIQRDDSTWTNTIELLDYSREPGEIWPIQ